MVLGSLEVEGAMSYRGSKGPPSLVFLRLPASLIIYYFFLP